MAGLTNRKYGLVCCMLVDEVSIYSCNPSPACVAVVLVPRVIDLLYRIHSLFGLRRNAQWQYCVSEFAGDFLAIAKRPTPKLS